MQSNLLRNRLIALVISFLCLLMVSNQVSSMILIRFATLAPEGSAWMETMHALDNDLREASGGEVGFKFYPNMSMGSEEDVIRKIRLGQINGAGFTGFGLGKILPEVRILELPYIFNNANELDFVTSNLTPYFEEKLIERGFVLLGWADVGWVYFFSQKPVAEPKDLKDLKVWMWEGDPLAEAFFIELGKSPIPLSITDVHMSLQTGLINSVYCSPLAALVLQWFTKVKYVSDIPFTNAIGAVLIDKKTFDKLKIEQQQMLLDISRQHLRSLVIQSRKDNQEAYGYLLQEGLSQTKSTQAQRDEMHVIGNAVYKRLVDDLYSNELLVRLRELLTEYRSNRNIGKEK